MKMTAKLLSAVLALLCVLQAQAEVPVQPDFNAAKFSGKWHVMATVSNCPIFQKMKQVMKTSAAIITFTPDDKMNLKIGYPVLDNCQKMELVFENAGQPGHYTHKQKGLAELRVMETDYEHYAIVYIFRNGGPDSGTTLQLFSRDQRIRPEDLERLKKVYPPLGLTENMLVILPKSDQCAKALST